MSDVTIFGGDPEEKHFFPLLGKEMTLAEIGEVMEKIKTFSVYSGPPVKRHGQMDSLTDETLGALIDVFEASIWGQYVGIVGVENSLLGVAKAYMGKNRWLEALFVLELVNRRA
ncbi:MAG: hypothetical protein L0Y74_10655, partial [candidate division Zixibacteria bacterium]|nr:hypothetical protein [candidate division Zixibacteria bacterium]